MEVEIVVAVDRYGGFGKAGKIPWTLPEDLEHFKQLTSGHVCVMGRRTYQEILDARVQRDAQRGVTEPIDQILRGRDTYVVTSNPEFATPGATRVDGLGQVMHTLNNEKDPRKIFVVGGLQLFIQGFSWANIVHLTLVKAGPYDCDIFFPIEILNKKFQIVSGKETDNAYYVVYNRK